MNEIWKFPILEEEVEIEAPIVEFLTVQMQGNIPCVWAIVNPVKASNRYKIITFGTGWEGTLDADRYIGTVQDGAFVWHYFWERVSNIRSPSEGHALSMFSSLSSR